MTTLGAVVALAFGGSMLVSEPAQALTGCPTIGSGNHCYALGTTGRTPTYFSSAGADLTAYCMQYSGDGEDFVDYETWTYTNGNVPGSATWVEGGITNGTIIDKSKNNYTTSGLQWFWADARPSGTDYYGLHNYTEHSLGIGYLNDTHNVAFYYQGNGNWNVYRSGVLVGTSVAVGAYAWRTDTGMESTTPYATVAGISRNFSYADGYGLHYINPMKDQDSGTWLYTSNGYVNGGMGSCTSSTAVTAAAAPSALLPMDTTNYRETLAHVTKAWATANGESSPSKISFVKTRRQEAMSLVGSRVADDRDVYFIQASGRFVGHRAHVPAGSALPTGSSMTLTVDAATGQILDWGISNDSRDISALGAPSNL